MAKSNNTATTTTTTTTTTVPTPTVGNVALESLKAGIQSVSINLLSLRELGIAGFCASASLKQMAMNSLSNENKSYVQKQLKLLGINC